MEKWEYLFARLALKGESIAYIGNIKLPNVSSLENTVRLLGEDGWELVTFGPGMIGVLAIFKRPWTADSYDVQSLISKLEAMPHLHTGPDHAPLARTSTLALAMGLDAGRDPPSPYLSQRERGFATRVSCVMPDFLTFTPLIW